MCEVCAMCVYSVCVWGVWCICVGCVVHVCYVWCVRLTNKRPVFLSTLCEQVKSYCLASANAFGKLVCYSDFDLISEPLLGKSLFLIIPCELDSPAACDCRQ